MKKNTKTTSPLKNRNGILLTWEHSPCWNHVQQQKIYHVLRFWLNALMEIPVNYLIELYIKRLRKIMKRQFYLKYLFLKKNIKNKKKKKYILFRYKKTLKARNTIKPLSRFWRPRHLLSSQVGVYSWKWSPIGLIINIPIFFLANKTRLNLLTTTHWVLGTKRKKQFKILFYKKAKQQTIRLFFFKLILERIFQKLFNFSIFLNFRHLLYMSKAELRLQSAQRSVYNTSYFLKKEKLFQRSVYLFSLGLYYAQSKIIAQQVANRLTRTRKHWKTLKQVRTTLHKLRMVFPETAGLQIDIFGKIGAKTRTKFFRITSGCSPKVQTLGLRIHYTYQDCFSFTGVFGIHVWLCATI